MSLEYVNDAEEAAKRVAKVAFDGQVRAVTAARAEETTNKSLKELLEIKLLMADLSLAFTAKTAKLESDNIGIISRLQAAERLAVAAVDYIKALEKKLEDHGAK